VYSWTVTHRPIDPGFADELPYAILVVETDEGPRLVGNLRGLAPSELRIGLAVEIVFEPVADNIALTHFRGRAR
jgi:Predicted nucleic-acid-binding protein containing a Zn-ribbon